MIVVTGASGQLGSAFRRRLVDEARFLRREDLDLTHTAAIRPALQGLQPTVIINCAAYTAVDRAEEEEATARTVNAVAVGELAASAADLGARFVTFSTDYVFDGTKSGPYVESDEPNPINVYGQTKLEGERLALSAHPEALVIRTSWVLSGSHSNFAATMMRLIDEGPVAVVDDQTGHPTLVDDLAAGTLAAIESGAGDVLHLTNSGTTTWYGLAREIAAFADLDVDRVRPITTDEFPLPARRPRNSVLESARLEGLGLTALPDYHPALQRAVQQLRSRS